jgi:hypothetical protein
MDYYMILLRHDKIDFAGYSPEDFQKIVADFDKWNAAMIEKGALIASGNLKDNYGKTIKDINVITDGPYAELKEAVTGFFIIRAENEQAALQIASGCPFLPRGGSIELRLMPDLELEDSAMPIIKEQMAARQQGKEA